MALASTHGLPHAEDSCRTRPAAEVSCVRDVVRGVRGADCIWDCLFPTDGGAFRQAVCEWIINQPASSREPALVTHVDVAQGHARVFSDSTAHRGFISALWFLLLCGTVPDIATQFFLTKDPVSAKPRLTERGRAVFPTWLTRVTRARSELLHGNTASFAKEIVHIIVGKSPSVHEGHAPPPETRLEVSRAIFRYEEEVAGRFVRLMAAEWVKMAGLHWPKEIRGHSVEWIKAMHRRCVEEGITYLEGAGRAVGRAREDAQGSGL